MIKTKTSTGISEIFNYCLVRQIFNESRYRIIAIACAYNQNGLDKNCGRWMRVSISGYTRPTKHMNAFAPSIEMTHRYKHTEIILKQKRTHKMYILYIMNSKWKFVSELFIIGIPCIGCDLMWYFGVHNLSTHLKFIRKNMYAHHSNGMAIAVNLLVVPRTSFLLSVMLLLLLLQLDFFFKLLLLN